MLNDKHMPKSYLAEAVNTTVYPMNRCTTSEVHKVTPHEKHYVHVPDEKRKKLDPKSEKCIPVGYSLEQKGYKCYNPSTQKVRVSRDVVFDESASWYEPGTTTT